MWPPPPGGTWVIDLDGVIWLTGHPIDGVDRAVTLLRAAGVRILFATNNSAPTRAELQARMANCGITTTDADLLSSADVAAAMTAHVLPLLAAGRVSVPICATFPMADATAAYQRFSTGGKLGKVVLVA